MVLGLSSSRGRVAGCRPLSGRLHLRDDRSQGTERPSSQRRRRGGHAVDVSQPLCAIPDRPGPATAARDHHGAADVGRPRGQQRLCRPLVAELRRPRTLPAAPRGRVPGVLRAHAGPSEPLDAERPGAARLRSLPLRRPRRDLDARRTAIPVARGVLRTAPESQGASRDDRRLCRTRRSGAFDDRPRAGAMAVRRPRPVDGSLERDRAGRADGAAEATDAVGRRRVLDRRLERLSGEPSGG